jgi:rifampicin phosphotransferase
MPGRFIKGLNFLWILIKQALLPKNIIRRKSMAELKYFFNTKLHPTLKEVGGKALSLIRTTRAGMPVPGGFVLCVAFFKPWTDTIKQTAEWKTLVKRPVKENCDMVKAIAEKLRFTGEQGSLLDEAPGELPETGVFAVRSSSPEEDLEGVSFAGMYETLLGTTRDKLEAAIARAYSSMFDFRVMEYKAQHNINLENASIAVIIQKQIASDVSGIGFSLNPLNNCYDEAVINASFGLGEAIVAGRVTPDSFVVEKVKMEILERNLGDKKTALHLAETGGILQKNNENPKARALTDEQILELTKLIKRCEDHYGLPVDIEWAYEAGKLYLLQARPITTYVPLFPEMITEPGERKSLYMDIMPLTQGFDDSLSILGGDIWAIVIEKLKRGSYPAGKDGYVLNLPGRQYWLLHNLFRGFGKKLGTGLPGMFDNAFKGHEEEIYAEYVSPKMTTLMKQGRKAQLGTILVLLPSVIKAMFRLEKEIQEMKDMFDDIIKQFKAMKNDRPFDELVECSFQAFDTAYSKFGVIASGLLAERKIKKMMKGTEAEELTNSILMDLPSNPTSAMGHAMLHLARFQEIQDTNDAFEFEKRVIDRSYSEEFLAALDDYMYKFGERGFKEIDVASKRMGERLDEFFLQLKSINITDNQMMIVTAKKEEALKKMREVAERKGKLKAFDKAVNTINKTYGHRETGKYLVVVMNGCLHRVALEIGDEFAARGRLKNREQIFDLYIEQISRAQKDMSLKLLPLIEENVKPLKIMERVKHFPCFIDSRGKIFSKIINPEEGDLEGIAVSSGVIKGKAKVLASPYEKPVEPGEILVAVATEPSWTPIFVNASGVVLEIGAGLQHGAIIAREYGLPCVSGLPGVTEIIRDGDLLEVDGTNGIVKILEPA